MLHSWPAQSIHVWDLVAAVTASDPTVCPEMLLAVDILVSAQARSRPDRHHQIGLPNTAVCLNPDPQQVRALAAATLGR